MGGLNVVCQRKEGRTAATALEGGARTGRAHGRDRIEGRLIPHCLLRQARLRRPRAVCTQGRRARVRAVRRQKRHDTVGGASVWAERRRTRIIIAHVCVPVATHRRARAWEGRRVDAPSRAPCPMNESCAVDRPVNLCGWSAV
eukprot:405625-Prymnesium_polylepis.2